MQEIPSCPVQLDLDLAKLYQFLLGLCALQLSSYHSPLSSFEKNSLNVVRIRKNPAIQISPPTTAVCVSPTTGDR